MSEEELEMQIRERLYGDRQYVERVRRDSDAARERDSTIMEG
jgi:hypothetical protein